MGENQLLRRCPFCGSELTYSENTLYCHNNQCNGIFEKVKGNFPYWKITFGIESYFSSLFEKSRDSYCYRKEKEKILSEIRNKISKALCDPDVLISRYDEQEFVETNKYGVVVSIESTIIFKVRDYDSPIT